MFDVNISKQIWYLAPGGHNYYWTFFFIISLWTSIDVWWSSLIISPFYSIFIVTLGDSFKSVSRGDSFELVSRGDSFESVSHGDSFESVSHGDSSRGDSFPPASFWSVIALPMVVLANTPLFVVGGNCTFAISLMQINLDLWMETNKLAARALLNSWGLCPIITKLGSRLISFVPAEAVVWHTVLLDYTVCKKDEGRWLQILNCHRIQTFPPWGTN